MKLALQIWFAEVATIITNFRKKAQLIISQTVLDMTRLTGNHNIVPIEWRDFE